MTSGRWKVTGNWFLLVEKITVPWPVGGFVRGDILRPETRRRDGADGRKPFAARVENALVSYGRYLGKLFWPENLAVVYPVVDHWPMHVVLSVTTLLLAVSIAAIVLRRSHPYLPTGWFWFIGTLVPVLGLVAVGEQSMADRYTYFPTIGVLLMIAWGAEE